MPKIKNIIIFIIIAAIFVLIYIYFIKPSSTDTPTLVSSSDSGVAGNTATPETSATTTSNSAAARDFLTLLLSAQSIKLDVAIFSDPAFSSLHDSSIVLIPDGNEGRPNPFAPIGSDVGTVPPLTCTLPKVLNPATNTCVNPSKN